MKKSFAVKCKQLVDKYADAIIDLIQSELSPEEICHDLMLCNAAEGNDGTAFDIKMLNRKKRCY